MDPHISPDSPRTHPVAYEHLFALRHYCLNSRSGHSHTRMCVSLLVKIDTHTSSL